MTGSELDPSVSASSFVATDDLRIAFSRALSEMYRLEVPQYGDLLRLVAEINAEILTEQPDLAHELVAGAARERLDEERHGAIRVGTVEELATIARAFALMGMKPVSYYNLAPAGVPVHSTAFRPTDGKSLAKNPFRVFTSLLRLELIEDEALRDQAADILSRRRIFTAAALELIAAGEAAGGLTPEQGERFVPELLETFRWHGRSTVDAETYEALVAAHRLIADVVCFPGPHINHLTPRTLDIDRAQAAMPDYGMAPKETIEGPPYRACPVLLRQTSFKALVESIAFPDDTGHTGVHTARFGEIEQRGVALTKKGRALYDALLDARAAGQDRFAELPDDWSELRRQQLAWFRYRAAPGATAAPDDDVEILLASGALIAEPIIYEDFLPVSAAGIFQSNLGDESRADGYRVDADRSAFETALGRSVIDEFALYEAESRTSLDTARQTLERAGAV